ncbi:leucine-rich repeat domain-containing protein [archaeon]|nr:MAG: leucine-rich repeat domain-containing protein [archaeon]
MSGTSAPPLGVHDALARLLRTSLGLDVVWNVGGTTNAGVQGNRTQLCSSSTPLPTASHRATASSGTSFSGVRPTLATATPSSAQSRAARTCTARSGAPAGGGTATREELLAIRRLMRAADSEQTLGVGGSEGGGLHPPSRASHRTGVSGLRDVPHVSATDLSLLAPKDAVTSDLDAFEAACGLVHSKPGVQPGSLWWSRDAAMLHERVTRLLPGQAHPYATAAFLHGFFTHLGLVSCHIRELEPEVSQFVALTELNVSRNQLTTLPLPHLPSDIQALHAYANRISRIELESSEAATHCVACSTRCNDSNSLLHRSSDARRGAHNSSCGSSRRQL